MSRSSDAGVPSRFTEGCYIGISYERDDFSEGESHEYHKSIAADGELDAGRERNSNACEQAGTRI